MSQASTAASITDALAGAGVGSQDVPMTESQQEEAKKAIDEQDLYVPFDASKPPPPQVAAPAAAKQKSSDDLTGLGGSEADAFDEEEASEEGTQMGDAVSEPVAAVISAAAAADWKVGKVAAKFFVENEKKFNELQLGCIADCAVELDDEEVKRTKKIYKYHLQRLLAAEEQTTMVESQDPFGEVVEQADSDEPASEDETDLMQYSALQLSRMKADAQTELDQLQAAA